MSAIDDIVSEIKKNDVDSVRADLSEISTDDWIGFIAAGVEQLEGCIGDDVWRLGLVKLAAVIVIAIEAHDAGAAALEAQ